MTFSKPKIPKQEVAPPPPTVDEAVRSSEEADKLRRRRGRLATVFAGRMPGGGAAPSVATKQLTGQ
jgi:hypothetical protein